MPEYAAKFKVRGLLVSGIEMPEREEVDKDFVFQRSASDQESWIALLRFKTEEEKFVSTSKAYDEEKSGF